LDITELILSDHHEQRRMFALLDEAGDDPARLGPIWDRLAILLEAHADAEEQLFPAPRRHRRDHRRSAPPRRLSGHGPPGGAADAGARAGRHQPQPLTLTSSLSLPCRAELAMTPAAVTPAIVASATAGMH
jgi:Hemerythrin HHE cation binding domain